MLNPIDLWYTGHDTGRQDYFVEARECGRQRWITIGRHGAPWTADTARNRAKSILGAIVDGERKAQLLRQLAREEGVDLQQVYSFAWVGNTDQLSRFYSGADEQLDAYTVDNQLQGLFATGTLRHTLLVGVDYQHRDVDAAWSSGSFPAIDAFDPHDRAAHACTRAIALRGRAFAQRAGVFAGFAHPVEQRYASSGLLLLRSWST